jgi:uncharacterized protein
MQLASRHPVAAYLGATYLLGIAIFAVPLLSRAGLGVLPIDLPGAAPFVLLSAILLTVVAFVVTWLADGPPGVRALRARALHFRVSPVWYLFAVAALPLVAIATAVVLAGVEPLLAILREPTVVAGWLVELLFAALLINYWEEVGWTGFVLHRLQPRIGPIAASVVTTWFQGALHLPLVFIAGGVTDGRVPPDQYPLYIVSLFVLPISVRIVLTWLYNRSDNSLPVVGLYHAGLGVATGSAFLPVIAPNVNSILVYAGFAVLALVVLVATRGRLGYVHPTERVSERERLADAQRNPA